MARDLRVDDVVFVPCTRLGLEDQPSALYETKVLEVQRRSVVVSLPGGAPSSPVGSALVHKNPGIVIIRIGDFATEATLLDPLAKSTLQFCRLLLHDSVVSLQEFRSLAELRHWWPTHEGAYSHVILVGHGRESGIRFGIDDWVDARTLSAALQVNGASGKVFVSLCCRTGYAAFGKALSAEPICAAAIGPFHTVHGAIASQFCQRLLAFHFLQGDTTAVAFRHASESVPGGASFHLWQKGQLTAGTRA